MPSNPRTVRRWRLAWWVASVLTVLNGLVVGVVSVQFQLFGDTADRGDYLVSAGGYLAAAAVVGVAVVPARGLGVSSWGVLGAAVAALCLGAAGLGSLSEAASLPPHHRPSAEIVDGIGGVLLLPWCWVLGWITGRAAWDGVRSRE